MIFYATLGKVAIKSCDGLLRAYVALSGRIGKVVASHAEVVRSIPGLAETVPIYPMHEALRGYCP